MHLKNQIFHANCPRRERAAPRPVCPRGRLTGREVPCKRGCPPPILIRRWKGCPPPSFPTPPLAPGGCIRHPAAHYAPAQHTGPRSRKTFKSTYNHYCEKNTFFLWRSRDTQKRAAGFITASWGAFRALCHKNNDFSKRSPERLFYRLIGRPGGIIFLMAQVAKLHPVC